MSFNSPIILLGQLQKWYNKNMIFRHRVEEKLADREA